MLCNWLVADTWRLFCSTQSGSNHVCYTGYTIREDKCIFPDGTSCDHGHFEVSTCGQTHHICTLRGGSLEMDQKTPVCRIDDKLYVWRVERVSQSKHGEWTVVLRPTTMDAL